MNTLITTAVSLLVVCAATVNGEAHGGSAYAAATATFSSDGIEGTISFEQKSEDSEVALSVDLKGLDKRASAYHIHVTPVGKGDAPCGSASTGGHFNPTGVDYSTSSCEPSQLETCEVGDLSGKWGSLADKDEESIAGQADPQLELTGPNSIVGRAIVLHGPDGERIQCANIEAPVGAATPAEAPEEEAPEEEAPKEEAPKDDAADAPTKSIVELAQATDDLSTLVTALTLDGSKGVLDTLSGDGPFTVFAPTNAAFDALKGINNDQCVSLFDYVIDPENSKVLASILTYHALAGKIDAAGAVELGSGGRQAFAETAQGEMLGIEVVRGEVKLNSDTTVTATDIMATNGVVHVIDSVLVPPTLLPAVAGFTERDCSPTPAPETPAPTAEPTVTPLAAALTKDLEGASGVCPYLKDASCFDAWLYVCESCCQTGMNAQGSTCWDDVFTPERCCSNDVVPSQIVCPYEADPSCFDFMYPCEKCCTTDLSITGGSCWDAVYTKSRCCNIATPVFAQPINVIPAPAIFAPIISAPTFFAPTSIGCADSNPVCGIWAQIGECTGGASTTVSTLCPQSCGGCGRRSFPRPTTLPDELVDSRGKPLPIHKQGDSFVDSRGRPLPMPTDAAKSSVNTGLVIGVAVAGVCLISLMVLVALVIRQRRNIPADTESNDVEMTAAATL